MQSSSSTRTEQLISTYLIQSQDSSDQTQFTLNQIIQLFIDHHLNLIDFILKLGPQLTSEIDSDRSNSIKLLSSVVSERLHHFKSSEIKHLINFFIDKLTDHPTVVLEALAALRTLSRSQHFQYDETVGCCKAIFTNLSNNELNQQGRLQVLILIDELLANHRPALKSMGDDFIGGYCNLVEGEKDPRNLLVAFKLDKVILTEFDISGKIEELFDITFCYFPITFRPPPGNPEAYGGITTEELTEGLISCFAATPRFAILTLPILLDKLLATSIGPKLQVLKTIIQAFPVYGQKAVAEFGSLYWEAFATEIFQPTEPDQELMKLIEPAFQTLLRTVFPPESSGPVELINQILDVTLHELASPEKSKAIPAAALIAWIITSGASKEDVIKPTIRRTIALYLTVWKDNVGGSSDSDERIRRRASLLSHLITFFTALAEIVQKDGGESGESGEQIMEGETRDELLGILISASLESSGGSGTSLIVSGAIRALVQMVEVNGLLGLQEKKNAVETATRVLMSSVDSVTRDAALGALAVLAYLSPADVSTLTIAPLFSKLPDASPFPTATTATFKQPKDYIRILEALATLCHQPDLFESFLVKMLNRIDFACSAGSRAAGREMDEEDHNLYAHHLFLTLYIVLETKSEDKLIGKNQLALQAERILLRIFAVFISDDEMVGRSLAEKDQGEHEVLLGTPDDLELLVVRERVSIRNDTRLVADAGRIVNLMVRQMDSKQQQDFANRLYACYQLGQTDALVKGAFEPNSPPTASMGENRMFRPMSTDAPESDKNMLVLYSDALVAIRPDVVIPGELLSTEESFPFKYYRHTLEMGASTKLMPMKAGLRLLCSTVNRRCNEFPNFFDEELSSFWRSEIEIGPLTQHQPRMIAIEIWIWIIKGLIVRGEKKGYELLDRFTQLWSEKGGSGKEVARLTGMIVDEVVGSRNFGVVKVLWKQRACSYLLDKLLEAYHRREDEDKTVYLIGLSSLLAHVTPQLILPELSKVIGLLLEGLNLAEDELKSNVLKTVYELMMNEESIEVFEPYLSSLVEGLLKGLQDPNRSEAVRLGSIKILNILPDQFKGRLTLWNQRSRVLIALKEGLDDSRRLVRRLAVDCRTKWFELKTL
ncbi:Dos2-interacting transcription regulator of RNA-Pol-II-domain-containing protein [Melampsora americana]|nr:Dos2-interacting transcription regulator of RNA-Pol-II-domain-containing protein [Melampsora americana]